MNLELILQKIWDTRSKDSLDGLENQESSEDFLQQAYQGRFRFELIQNGRDAAKSAGIDGSILIVLEGDCLSISNSGAPFDEKGVIGISLIGKSSKGAGGFIGFKGIGFKSIQEISATPKVVTKFGSIQFSKQLSYKKMGGRFTKATDIPLFFLPHFDALKLTDQEMQKGVVSRIDLTIRPEIDQSEIITSFSQITELQLILLGYVRKIEFKSETYNQIFLIEKRSNRKLYVYNNGKSRGYKLYSPKEPVRIPEELLKRLPAKELELFEKDPIVDISLAFEIGENDRLKLILDSKLYLYFPLKISSGFSFVIHSLFLVDPQRSGLRSAILNEFILERIADYIGGEWLAEAKKNHQTTYLHFLAFKRNSDENLLNILYDRLISKLENQKFIYEPISRRFHRKNEVIIADAVDKNLFPGHMIKGKRLIYVKNSLTSNWLISEMKVECLHHEDIEENIEEECKRQAKANNLIFFQKLYEYVADHKLNLTGRKVLLTDKWQLYRSDNEVFNGMDNTRNVRLSSNIRRKIHILHPRLKISNARQVRERLGFIEYNTETLIRRLLGLYEDPMANRWDILDALLSLPLNVRLSPLLVKQILLPVKIKGDPAWKNPLSAPIYFEVEDLQLLYPDAAFLDTSGLGDSKLTEKEMSEKFALCGVWEIPALYYTDTVRRVEQGTPIFKTIAEISGLSTPYFEITGDWILDFPEVTTEWFMRSLIANWKRYKEIISEDEFVKISYRSQTSGRKFLSGERNYDVSSFKLTISSERWIHIGQLEPEPIREIIGVNHNEKVQRKMLLSSFFKLFTIEYAQFQIFINDVDLRHLSSSKLKDFENILRLVKGQYEIFPPAIENFRKAYNIILNKLFELYSFSTIVKNDISNLKKIPFLCRDEYSGKMFWKPAEEIYYVDNRTALDAYPEEVKQVIQPQFTIIDKGRFGQIGRKIGIDFRDVIKEELQPIVLTEQILLIDYIPELPACLALIEISLEEPDFEQRIIPILSQLRMGLTEFISVNVYKHQDWIAVHNPPYHVTVGEDSEILAYAIPSRRAGMEHPYNAGLLMAIINQFVDKDVQRVEVCLTDYYDSSNKAGYLARNGVDGDRVNDILELLQEKTYTPRHNFWNQVIKTRVSGAYQEWLLKGDLDFEIIAKVLGFRESLLREIDKQLDYQTISSSGNLTPIKTLLELLKYTLSDFIDFTGIYISFQAFYMKEFEMLKILHKPNFEMQLYECYKVRPVREKERFSNQLLRYDYLGFSGIENIEISVSEILLQQIRAVLPTFTFTNDNNITENGMLSKIYHENYQKLLVKCAKKNISKESIEIFLVENRFRSLVYFNALEDLIKRFNFWVLEKQAKLNNDGSYKTKTQIDLSNFVNLPGTVILGGNTTAIPRKEHQEKGGDKKTRGASRVIGGSNQNSNDITGLVAERQVYEILKLKYTNLEWVSTNAAIAGVNPEGNDSYHFDMQYIAEDLKTQYVEVKGTSGSESYFYISSNEVDFARTRGNDYHLFFVINALDNIKRKITDLGNPFQIDKSESVFQNQNFTAVFDTLKIIFQLTK